VESVNEYDIPFMRYVSLNTCVCTIVAFAQTDCFRLNQLMILCIYYNDWYLLKMYNQF